MNKFCFRITFYFLAVNFFLQVIPASSQVTNAIRLDTYQKIIASKVAWVSNNRFCIVTDKNFSDQTIPHFVSIFDLTGKPVHDPVKLKLRCSYSCQHEYCLAMGTTVYFLENREEEMIHRFIITHEVNETGKDNDSLVTIFKIRENEEQK